MSVKDRIEDAQVLWEKDHWEGAVSMVLIAVAATVRKRYPMPMPDNIAYKRFIQDELSKITNGPQINVAFYFDGDPHVPIEDIIYTFLRCELLHEGRLPDNITLTKPVPGDGKPIGKSPDGSPYDGKLFNRLVLDDVLGFPIGWIWNLIRVVAEAPENRADFSDGSYPLPNGYSVSAGLQLEYPDEHPERFPPNAPPRVKTKSRPGDRRLVPPAPSCPRFNRSYDSLQEFLATWLGTTREQCMSDDQRKAAFYVWARYSMSINTIRALVDPKLVPDLAVICRGCLEFDVSLEAVMKDKELARKYLEYEKDAKARYLKILREQGDLDRVMKRGQQFEEEFGEDPQGSRLPSWYHREGGIAGIMRRFERDHERRVYAILSHMAHGSVWAMKKLDEGAISPADTLRSLIDSTYTAYMDSSRKFLTFIWEPLVLPDGEKSKKDFEQVMAMYVGGESL